MKTRTAKNIGLDDKQEDFFRVHEEHVHSSASLVQYDDESQHMKQFYVEIDRCDQRKFEDSIEETEANRQLHEIVNHDLQRQLLERNGNIPNVSFTFSTAERQEAQSTTETNTNDKPSVPMNMNILKYQIFTTTDKGSPFINSSFEFESVLRKDLYLTKWLRSNPRWKRIILGVALLMYLLTAIFSYTTLFQYYMGCGISIFTAIIV